MTPTPEQIEAELKLAREISCIAVWDIAKTLATVRLEGEAAGRNKALDEAVSLLEQYNYLNAADAILALKGQTRDKQ